MPFLLANERETVCVCFCPERKGENVCVCVDGTDVSGQLCSVDENNYAIESLRYCTIK